jgi:predicted transcriptional regulator
MGICGCCSGYDRSLGRILDHARDHGRVTIREMVTVTGANRNTLKVHLRSLVKDRGLVQHGAGRGSWYALP